MRFALLAAALIVSTPALANDATATAGTSQEATAAASAEQAKEPKKICRRIAASESRLAAKKVCLTAEDWKRRDLEEM